MKTNRLAFGIALGVASFVTVSAIMDQRVSLLVGGIAIAIELVVGTLGFYAINERAGRGA